jgi:hypothetical protein
MFITPEEIEIVFSRWNFSSGAVSNDFVIFTAHPEAYLFFQNESTSICLLDDMARTHIYKTQTPVSVSS